MPIKTPEMEDECELLFFDTFSHDSYEELNLDLVQFPHPVYIFEIRVIPLGARVQADFPGGYRLGATNPSAFQLEFFANDLSKRSACTFLEVGRLQYKQNVDIQLPVNNGIPTDGLVLRGLYSAVTLAIYGNVARTKERTPPAPPQPPSVSRSQPQDPRPGEHAIHESNWDRHNRSTETKSEQPIPSHQTIMDANYPSMEPHIPYAGDIPQTYSDPPPATYSESTLIFTASEKKKQQVRLAYTEKFNRWTLPRDARFPRHEEGYLNTGYRLPDSDFPPFEWNERHESDQNQMEHDNPHKRSSIPEYKDEPDREYKKKDYRSWEDYQDRPRKDSSRDRDKDRERGRDGRDKPRSHDGYSDRGSRVSGKRPMTPPTPPPSHSSPQTPPEVEKIGGPRTPKEEDPSDKMYEESSPAERKPLDPMYNLSEGEIQEGDNTDDDGYEEIVSEEEIMSDGEDNVMGIGDIDYDFESWNSMSSFSPYSCELTSCQHFCDPTATEFETLNSKKNDTAVKSENKSENGLLEIIQNFKNDDYMEKWIEAIEHLDFSFLAQELISLDSKETFDDVATTLVDWVVKGLDFQSALQQPQTAYKVRHIKAGIRLASFLFQTDVNIVKKLLEKEVPRLLLQMCDQPYVVLPIKLLIIRALDFVTYTEKGLSYMANHQLYFEPPFDFNSMQLSEANKEEKLCSKKTVYQKLLELLLSKQLTRVASSVMALLKKFHLYETVQYFHKMSEILVKNCNVEQKNVTGEELPTSGQESFDQVDGALEENIQVVIMCLKGITTACCTATRKLAQPKRVLPAKMLLEYPKSPSDPFPGLLRMLKESLILEALQLLVSSPILVGHSGLMIAVRNLMTELLHTQDGMLFLLSKSDVINGIQKALLQNIELSSDDIPDENIAVQLGMTIVYRLQALLYLDALCVFHSKGGSPEKALDNPDVNAALHHIYSMTFSTLGRISVIEVLASNDNLKPLLQLLKITGDKEKEKIIGKSASAGYVAQLITFAIEYSENISILVKFSQEMLEISNQENMPKLQTLVPWLTPATNVQSYTEEAIPYLCGVCKTQMENYAGNVTPDFLTAVRILKHICIPEGNNAKELKYMCATIQLFGNDGLSCFVSVLQKICDSFHESTTISATLVGTEGIRVVHIVKPILSMIKSMLNYLISCQSYKFKDLTAVPALLRVSALVMMIPTTSFAYYLVSAIQSDIVEILLSFTQAGPMQEETEESLSKSLWSQMVQNILTFTVQIPKHFIAGLSLLSELLPLPLPLQSSETLTSEEVTLAINHRKLWSAHLHPLNEEIREIVSSLAITSFQPLQQLLRRVCIQLSDLASPTSLIVVRGVLDSLMEALEWEHKDSAEGPTSTPIPQPCSTTVTRILNLIAYLVSHTAFKVSFMHVLKASTKVDEKYSEVLSLVLSTLNVPSELPQHIQAQEWIVSVLQTLCDPDIGLATLENGASVNDVLSNCLPCKEHLALICSSLIQHIGSDKHHFSSILLSLRCLVMLSEHDYGFYHLKQSLECHPDSLLVLFSRLNASFNIQNADCLVSISTALEFLRLMVQGYEEGAQTGRSMVLPASELSHYFFDKSTSETSEDSKQGRFPSLSQLEKLMSEHAQEEVVESLLENLTSIISLLNESFAKEEKSDIKEPVLPPCENLCAQFSSRPVFVVGEVDEERLTSAYWLSIPVLDEIEESEQVSRDMVALADKCGFDLKEKIEVMYNASVHTMKDRTLSSNVKEKYIDTTENHTNKRTFIAPMRGRGFSRVTTHMTRANDPFRSRPPNTSRPPSMHVDDFVALESHHNGSNNQPQQKRQDGNRGRGRGFDRNPLLSGTRSGGRFFSPPGPYSQRDSNTRIELSGNRGNTRLSNSPWGNRTSGMPKSTNNVGVRASFGSRTSISERYSTFSSIEPRLSSQRSHDPYGDSVLASGSNSIGHFPRSVRMGNSLITPLQGHWQETRNKAQNQKFMSGTSQIHGGGRRDLNGRHDRTYTR